ncbi:MAG: hypothetical protein N2234_05700 [Planctomycetota bacterium]|nr:hypothetical protein [Planctomycetota bacterium]
MRFLVVFVVLVACSSIYCDDTLWSYVSAPAPSQTVFDTLFRFVLQQEEEQKSKQSAQSESTEDKLELKEGEIQRTQRLVTTAEGRFLPRPFRQPSFGLKFSVLMPSSAQTDAPDAGLTLGLLLRFPVHPGYYQLGRVELASTFSVSALEMNNIQGGVTYDEVYETYWDVTVCYLGTFIPYPEMRHLYWGVGFGIGQETITYEQAGTETDVDNSTGVLVFKLGWDSYINFYFELSYRRLLDSNRNISDMFEFCFGIYF